VYIFLTYLYLDLPYGMFCNFLFSVFVQQTHYSILIISIGSNKSLWSNQSYLRDRTVFMFADEPKKVLETHVILISGY